MHWWHESSSAQIAQRISDDPDCVALIPVGATEQHGPHLPVGTDTIIAAQLACAAAGDAAIVLPPLAFGASFFHGTQLAGTVAFSGEDTAAAAGGVAEFRAELVLQGGEFLDGIIGGTNQRTGDSLVVVIHTFDGEIVVAGTLAAYAWASAGPYSAGGGYAGLQ